MAETVLLKKYPNRRLYDTEKSTYVTLHQVADMIRHGLKVEVVDAKTDEDVTPFILIQIILENAKVKNSPLPTSLLHLIIQYGENVLGEFFEKFLQQAIENYLAYKTASDEQFKKWLSLSTNFSDTAKKTMTGMMNPYASFLNPLSAHQESARKEEKRPQKKRKIKK